MRLTFYILSILPMCWMLYKILWTTEYYKVNLSLEQDVPFQMRSEEEKRVVYCDIGCFIFLFAGLFSFNWWVFMGVLGARFIPKQSKRDHFISAFLQLMLMAFAVFNAFYFRFDIIQILFGNGA